MCDIWFTKYDNPSPGGYRAGMPVDITDDGIAETCAARQNFHIVSLPGVPKNDPRIQKYLEPHYQDGPEIDPVTLERRRWRLRLDTIPAEVKARVADKGKVVLKSAAFSGVYDYLWTDIRQYLRDFKTGLDETEVI